MPNSESTEQLIRGYVEAIASGDLERVFAFYDEDIVYEDTAVAQTYHGIEATKKFYTVSMSALDVRWRVDTIVATEESYGLAWVMTGRHVHDLPGMPATGRSFEVPGASVGEVRNGKITRNRDFWNHHDMLKQLGYRLLAPQGN
jgi:steroid delta-isomerase-like uncharacterized protein